MSFLSRLVTLFGLVLLAHAGYSAHEHTVLFSNTRLELPQDIIVETLVAVVVVSVGLVLGAEKLKPISWRDWAGEIERDGGARNPYLSLEERYGFWDIRVSFPPAVNERHWIAFDGHATKIDGLLIREIQAKRKEFADWMRGPDALVKE